LEGKGVADPMKRRRILFFPISHFDFFLLFQVAKRYKEQKLNLFFITLFSFSIHKHGLA